MQEIIKRLDRIEDKLDKAICDHNECRLKTSIELAKVKTNLKSQAKIYGLLGTITASAMGLLGAFLKH